MCFTRVQLARCRARALHVQWLLLSPQLLLCCHTWAAPPGYHPLRVMLLRVWIRLSVHGRMLERGLPAAHLCVCGQEAVPPTSPAPAQPASMGPSSAGKPSPTRHRLHSMQPGCDARTGWGSHRAGGRLCTWRGPHAGSLAAAGLREARLVLFLPGCDPPSRGCPAGPGLGGCPVRAHWGAGSQAGHLRESDPRRVKGGAPTPEIPPNMALGCPFCVTLHFANVADAIKIQQKTWEGW